MIYTILNYLARAVVSLTMVTGAVSVLMVIPIIKRNKYQESEIKAAKDLFFSSVLARDFAFLIIVVIMLTSQVPKADMLFSLTLIKMYSCVSAGIFVVATIESFIHAVLSGERTVKKFLLRVRLSSAFSAILGFLIVYIFE